MDFEQELTGFFGLSETNGADGGDASADNPSDSSSVSRDSTEAATTDVQNNTDNGVDSVDTENENSTDSGEAPPAQKRQSKEKNASFAAARRQAEAERDAAIAKAQADADSYIEDTLRSLGLTNPYRDGKIIATKADYEEYKKDSENTRRREFAKNTGMTEDELDAFISDLPEVREAKAVRERIEAAEKERRDNEARAEIDRQIAHIATLNPEIKSIEDLSKHEKYSEIYELVRRGYAIDDAYMKVDFEKIADIRAKNKARQEASIGEGTSHLRKTVSRGGDLDTPVPSAELQMYRALNPDASIEEITKHYNKMKNKK